VRTALDGLKVGEFVEDAYNWHPPTPDIDIHSVIWRMWNIHSPEGGGSTSGVVMGILPDGRWVVVEGSSDYTGWDCQSGAVWSTHKNLNDAIRYGLTNETRRLLDFGV